MKPTSPLGRYIAAPRYYYQFSAPRNTQHVHLELVQLYDWFSYNRRFRNRLEALGSGACTCWEGGGRGKEQTRTSHSFGAEGATGDHDIHITAYLLTVVTAFFDDKSLLQPSRGLDSGPRKDGKQPQSLLGGIICLARSKVNKNGANKTIMVRST